jgi:hypothetical protein
MEKFEHIIPEEPKGGEDGVEKKSIFGRMNQERRDRDYAGIREQMEKLSELITQRDGGTQGLEGQISQVSYRLKSSVEDFCRTNPTDARGVALKNMVGLK